MRTRTHLDDLSLPCPSARSSPAVALGTADAAGAVGRGAVAHGVGGGGRREGAPRAGPGLQHRLLRHQRPHRHRGRREHRGLRPRVCTHQINTSTIMQRKWVLTCFKRATFSQPKASKSHCVISQVHVLCLCPKRARETLTHSHLSHTYLRNTEISFIDNPKTRLIFH